MPELEVEICSSCLGFWLDNGELEDVRNMAMKIESELSKGVEIYMPRGRSNTDGGGFDFDFDGDGDGD